MMNVVVGALVVLLLASLFGVVRGVLLVVRLRRIGAPRGAVHTRWPLPAPAARPATAPPPQPLTGGHAPPPAPPRAAGAPGGAQALSRLEKLEIAREVLDHRFPADLQEELDGYLAQRTASASHAGGGDLETSAALPPRLDAPDEPPELTALAGALDLATGAGPDDFGSSIVDRRPLLPPPDVAAVTPARAWYGPLLSFENVLFLLSGVLILGGTVYFAATTWGRVPGRWQPLYLEALVLVYALLLVGAGQLLLRRLRLPGAARILLAIAAAVGLLSALVAATTPAAYAQTAVLCAVIAALFAGGTLGRLLRGYDDPGRGAALFGGAALLLGLTGVAALWAPLLGAPLAAAGAATLACAALPRQGPSGHRLVVSLAGAVPLTALLIPLGGAVPLLAVAPAIGAWTWLAALGYGPTDGAGGGPALGFGGTRLAPALLFGAVGLGGVACWGEPAPTLLFALVALGGAADAARRAPGLRGPVRAALAVWALAVAALPFAIRDLWPAALSLGAQLAPQSPLAGLAAVTSLMLALVPLAWAPRSGAGAAAGLAALSAALWSAGIASQQPHAAAPFLGGLAGVMGIWAFRSRHPLWSLAGHAAAVGAVGAVWPHARWAWPAALAATVSATIGAAQARRDPRHVPAALLLATVAAIWLALWALDPVLAPDVAAAASLGVCAVALLVAASRGALFGAAEAARFALLPLLALATIAAAGACNGRLPTSAHAMAAVAVLGVAAALAEWRLRPRWTTFLAYACVGALGAARIDPSQPAATLGLVALGAVAFLHAGRVRWPGAGPAAIVAVGCAALAPFMSWPAGLGVGAAAGHAQVVWPPALGVGLGGLGGGLLLCLQARRTRSVALSFLALGELWVAANGLLIAIARHVSTGADPLRVLPVAALTNALLAAGLVGGAHHITPITRRVGAHVASAVVAFALLLGAAGANALRHPAPMEVATLALCLGVLAATAGVLSARLARGWPLYITQGSAALLYGYLRWRTDWLDGLAGYDAVVLAAAAFAQEWLALRLQARRAGLGSAEAHRVAVILPLAIPFLLGSDLPAATAVGAAAAAVLYGRMAGTRGQMIFGWLAALMANLILVPFWLAHGVAAPSAWLLPAGVSLVLLVRLYEGRLGSHEPVLRTVAGLLIYGATTWDAFTTDGLWPLLALGAVGVCGVLLGVWWRIRSFLYLGFAFVVLDLAANVTRLSLGDRLLTGIAGVSVGVLLFAIGVAVALHKERLLARYRAVQTWAW